MSVPRHIAIVALRRSGTTALWNLLRQDARFTCYDEPFSPLFRDLPAENKKSTRSEFIALYNRDPQMFREKYAPIVRREEVTRGLSQAQVAYLEYLTGAGPTIFDVTRCMGKVPDLYGVLPDAALIHLYRHPVAFVSSHLLPSDRFDVFGMRKSWHRHTAFSRKGGYNGWGMEELTRTDHFGATRDLLRQVCVELPEPGSATPAYQRLLAIWLGAFRLAEREGRECFGDRFVSLSFEDLCQDPASQIAAIFAAAEVETPAIDTSGLKPASTGFRAGDARWREGAVAAGFDQDEMNRFFPVGSVN